MATLEKIKEMQMQGYDDADIVNNLQQQGVSPREINESLSQSKIKAAVADQGNSMQVPQQTREINPNQDMQPSLMNTSEYSQTQEISPQEPLPTQPNQPISQAQEFQAQEIYPKPTMPEQTMPSPIQKPTQQYPTQNYPQEYGYQEPSYSSTSTDTISEVAEQIIDEKLNQTKSTMKALAESKILLGAQVEKIDQRLQRIESVIDQLQTSLIRGAGAQAQNIEDIKNEMRGMQNSFSKVINPLIDKSRKGKTSKK